MTTASYSGTSNSAAASGTVADRVFPRVQLDAGPPPSGNRWLQALLRGRDGDPRWVRPSLLGIMVASGVLYLWGLGASGYANSFYSAAVQAGAHSWKAPHTGAIPSAGPTVATSFGGPGGGRNFGGQGGQGAQGGQGGQGFPGLGGAGTTGGTGGMPSFGGNGVTGRTGGGLGGLLDSSTPSAAIQALLNSDASSYTWVAATVGANHAAGYQLATGHAVMAIGGFNGTDPSPTLAQFKAYVAAGKIHYFIPGGTGGGMGGTSSSTASQITSWVESHYTAKAVNGKTVYDLTAPTS